MKTKLLVLLVCVGAMFLSTLSCSTGSILGPTKTPTPTATPIPTPTPTPIPGGVLTGRVYLIDREEAVRTTVILYQRQGEDNQEVARTSTDENGIYYFLITEPGSYNLNVSVTRLLDKCDNLRLEVEANAPNEWPIIIRNYDQSGLAETLAQSVDKSISVGDEITLNLDLTCD